MKEEKNNPRIRLRQAQSVRGRQNKKEKEECPLCNVSEETIRRLKAKKVSQKDKSKSN